MMCFFKHSWIAAGLVCSAAALGCSDEPENGSTTATISTAGSGAATKVDVATSQAALTELTGSVDTTITGYKPAGPPPAPGATAEGGTVAVRCAPGGSAMVGGRVNVALQPVTVDVNVAIDYEGCVTPTGTTMTGSVDFTQSVVAGAGTPVRVQTVYKGNVVFTGKVNASCPVDLNVLVDEAGRAVEVMGSFCGNDASSLNVQVMPRWQQN